MATLTLDVHYRVEGHDGIAWLVLGYVERIGPDTKWDGLCVTNTDWVRAVMVGDDRVREIDVNLLVPISETEFCRDCGQMGCTSNAAAVS